MKKEGYTNRAMEKVWLSVSFPCEMSILVYLQKVLLRMLAWMCEGGGGSGGSGGGGGSGGVVMVVSPPLPQVSTVSMI